ncbi:MAG: hypothetical protein LBL59_01260 [Xanthomonadaceae bacterium]|jgi:hypothetical protein|nr:hypothetical protein [Xanthomonadaceae bacterium]
MTDLGGGLRIKQGETGVSPFFVPFVPIRPLPVCLCVVGLPPGDGGTIGVRLVHDIMFDRLPAVRGIGSLGNPKDEGHAAAVRFASGGGDAVRIVLNGRSPCLLPQFEPSPIKQEIS